MFDGILPYDLSASGGYTSFPSASMDVLLLSDIAGVGTKNELLSVSDGFALNHLLPHRKALVATPDVRRRFAEQIKARAEAKEKERQLQASMSNAIGNKSLTITAKASAAGKLFAAVSPALIAERIKEELGFDIPEDSIEVSEHIKTTGKHTVSIKIGSQSIVITLVVNAMKEGK